MKKINFYIHIPFCQSKCNYCTFYSLCNQENNLSEYFEVLEKEIISYKNKLKNYEISTIYFGGGTPNLVDAYYLTNLIKLISNNFECNKDIEITVECNPEFIEGKKLNEYKDNGVNRISVGIQSFDEDVLNILGRKWNIQKRDNKNYFDFIKEKINLINSGGFDNYGFDLIFGINGQSFDSFKDSLEKAISLKPKHISCYSLELDENSVLGKKNLEAKYKIINEVMDRKMYWYAVNYLKQKKFVHYEISNFAKKDYICKHNWDFWLGKEYIGFGAGAYSYFKNKYFCNPKLDEYLKGEKKIYFDNFNKREEMVNFCRLSLRLINHGLSFRNFDKKFGNDFMDLFEKKVKELELDNLINVKKDRVILTKKGIDLENLVCQNLL